MPDTTTTPRAAKKAPARKTTTPPPAPISTGQMRHLHGLLRSRLGLHDRADVLDWLSLTLERDVPTRRDLTRADADTAIAALEPLPPMGPDADDFAALRAPFPEEAIGRLPRSTCRACSNAQNKRCEQHSWIAKCDVCNGRHSSATMHIDYVGHADVTARLLAVDPHWTWEPMALDPQSGMPLVDRSNGLWIRLTVLGVTRPGYGDMENGKGVKEAIGDALRNAAMRFGVALDLWAKGDREWAREVKTGEHHPDDSAPVEDTPPEPWHGPTHAQMLARIDAAASLVDLSREQVTAKFRADHGNLPLSRLADVPPAHLLHLTEQIEDHVATMIEKSSTEEPNPDNTDGANESVNPWAE